MIFISLAIFVSTAPLFTKAFLIQPNLSRKAAFALRSTDNNYQRQSSFDSDVPSGLRAEAVLSSIRNVYKGIWFEPTKDLNAGVVGIKGDGTLTFLTNKFTSVFQPNEARESCLLTGKGAVIDKVLIITISDKEALLITSANHGKGLFEQLNKLIFPFDQVTIEDCSSYINAFCVASTTLDNAHSILYRHMNNILPTSINFSSKYSLLQHEDNLLICQGVGFPKCALQGYTIISFSNDISSKIRNNLTHEEDITKIPLQLKYREYDNLRIHAGVPIYSLEYIAHIPKNQTEIASPPTPLELLLHHTIDFEKGCYVGQEKIAAVVKNPLGPARTLHQIVFYDHSNDFKLQSIKKNHKLFVLGSNQEISVGYLTSKAERGGTGKPCLVALALLSRSSSILAKMRNAGLDIDYQLENDNHNEENTIMSPLDGLEVILENTYLVGVVQSLPVKRIVNTNLFDSSVSIDDAESDEVFTQQTKEEHDDDMEAILKAEQEAKAAEEEAKRKAEKLEMLKKRAEAALKARNKK